MALLNRKALNVVFAFGVNSGDPVQDAAMIGHSKFDSKKIHFSIPSGY